MRYDSTLKEGDYVISNSEFYYHFKHIVAGKILEIVDRSPSSTPMVVLSCADERKDYDIVWFKKVTMYEAVLEGL